MTASWWWHRLRAMTPAEVVHRVGRLARRPLDRVAIRAGRYGRPSPGVGARLDRWRGPAPFYFPPALVATPLATPAVPGADADAVLAGRPSVLGLGPVELPADPWHLEPRTGASWARAGGGSRVAASGVPVELDRRLTWELNRGHGWVLLARAAAATGDRRYRDELARQLTSWRTHNPIGEGINWSSAMEAAIRVHSLVWVSGFLRGVDDAMLPRLAHDLHAHLVFVADHLSAHSSANNHLIVELSALVVGTRALGVDELDARWRAPADARLRAELTRQILADGVDAEMASHYHAFVLEAVLLVAYLERAHGAAIPEVERVGHAMADHLRELSCPGGEVLGYGDSDDGRILPWAAVDHEAQLIATADALGDRGDQAALDGAPSVAPDPRREATYWITGGAPRRPARPPTRSRWFEPSGQVVLRGPRLLAVLDAGPFGFGALAAHAHCDALAVHVALDGRPIVVDRGTYLYASDPAARAWFRGTAAHNTVQLGDREQASAHGPFLWGRKPTAHVARCELGAGTSDDDVVDAWHDGFAPAIHRRSLRRRGDVLVVRDVVERGARERAVARFHLAPGLTMRAQPTTGGARWRVEAAGVVVGSIWTSARSATVEPTAHSARYGERTTARTMTCELDADRPLTTMLAPPGIELPI